MRGHVAGVSASNWVLVESDPASRADRVETFMSHVMKRKTYSKKKTSLKKQADVESIQRLLTIKAEFEASPAASAV